MELRIVQDLHVTCTSSVMRQRVVTSLLRIAKVTMKRILAIKW